MLVRLTGFFTLDIGVNLCLYHPFLFFSLNVLFDYKFCIVIHVTTSCYLSSNNKIIHFQLEINTYF